MIQTFKITITSRDHCTWQGVLTTAQETIAFQSELELLLAMMRQLETQHSR